MQPTGLNFQNTQTVYLTLNKKTNDPIENGQETQTDISPRKM